MYSVQEFGFKCLPYTLDDVLRFGNVINTPQADERGRVVERREVPLFDADAFREAVINAFVHNKWVSGNEPMITVYSDRIEVLSRGTLDPEQTMEGFFMGESVPVNRKLSEIMLQLHISEKTGRGVPAIVRRYGREAFTFRENSIVVTIPFERIHAVDGASSKLESKISNKVSNKISNKTDRADEIQLTKSQEKILAEIRNNPNITRKQLEMKLVLADSTIYKGITTLKERGYIERAGSRKTGYWRVLR